MNIQIENISKKDGWFSFTLTLLHEGLGYVRMSGWKYFISTGSVGAPAKDHGRGYFPTVWLGGFLYDQVKEQVQNHFIDMGLCEEPWELPESRPKEETSKKKKLMTQDEWNEQQLDKLATKRKEK